MVHHKQIYTCPYCFDQVASFGLLKMHVIKKHRSDPIPLSANSIEITLNGQAYNLNIEPEWTLYFLIHDILGFTGTKVFCDSGVCGACTVIVDGRPTLSCITLAVECDGKVIETIEGIESAEHALIESYVNNHAMQCGFCTPGFVVTAKALLDRNPTPKEADIRDALAGNLCRCGTYPQHPKAVMEAADKMQRSRTNKGAVE